MMLKSEKGTQEPSHTGHLAASVSRMTRRAREHSPAQPGSRPLGRASGLNSTSVNVAFHWNGFSSAALSKTEHCQCFELSNVVADLWRLPSPATNSLGHSQVPVFIGCTTPSPQGDGLTACAEAQFAPLAVPALSRL